jgi:hypothetical protein
MLVSIFSQSWIGKSGAERESVGEAAPELPEHPWMANAGHDNLPFDSG